MPRKPKREKHITTVVVNEVPVRVILHPPTKVRKSWYAYWPGLTSSVSTGERQLDDAVVAAKRLVENGGKHVPVRDAVPPDDVLSDEEFEEIQVQHFGRRKDPAGRARATKSLKDCREAIETFRLISGVKPISKATPDQWAAFQREALHRPKDWRRKYPNSQEAVDRISSNTVLKWSRALRAAFERANRNAGKKCVRGVVDPNKLLTDNPWNQFTWAVEEVKRPIRQFDGDELLAVLDFLEKKWLGITAAPRWRRSSCGRGGGGRRWPP